MADLFAHDAQIANMRKQCNTANLDLWDRVKRVHTGVKSVFGDNSSEVEVIGRQIGVEDAALDRLVYELYGLTEEEIGIVEGR